MPFQIKTRTIIESATIELTGLQLQDLATARDALQRLIDEAGNDPPLGIQPARELLNTIASLVHGATIATPTKRPQSEAQIASQRANAIRARAAKAARLNPQPGQPDDED